MAPGWSCPLSRVRRSAYSVSETTSTVVGMTAWRIPQSSAHWPSNVPSRLGRKLSVFVLPGMASRFPVISGTHQLWITS